MLLKLCGVGSWWRKIVDLKNGFLLTMERHGWIGSKWEAALCDLGNCEEQGLQAPEHSPASLLLCTLLSPTRGGELEGEPGKAGRWVCIDLMGHGGSVSRGHRVPQSVIPEDLATGIPGDPSSCSAPRSSSRTQEHSSMCVCVCGGLD